MRELDNMGIIVSNIQRMCFHDGPGIRTTVFLKGCSLHCPWCANPENVYQNKIYGRVYNDEELMQEILKDECFWENGGGVTFSGGEPLLQAERILPVLKLLKERGMHIAIETSLFAEHSCLEMISDYIDFWYVDVKILDKDSCRNVMGGDIDLYVKNIQYLVAAGKDIHFRIPCSRKYVLTERNKEMIYQFFSDYCHYPVEIFKLHNMAEKKYEALGLKFHPAVPASESEMDRFEQELIDRGVSVSRITI